MSRPGSDRSHPDLPKLEGSAFHWPKPDDGVIRLSPAPFAALFAALFEGIDWRAVSAERRQRPRLAG